MTAKGEKFYRKRTEICALRQKMRGCGGADVIWGGTRLVVGNVEAE